MFDVIKRHMMLDADTGGGGGDGEEAKPTEPVEDSRTFTQAELDEIVTKRLERERKKYADYDDLKSQLQALAAADEERKRAEMSEKERLEADMSAALKKAEEAEQARSKALETANQRLINAEFKVVAKEAGIEYVDDALRLADLSGVSVDEEGNVTGVKEVIEALVESKPYLVAQKEAPKPRPIGGANNPPRGNEQKTKEQLLQEAADKARRSGKIEDRVAYANLKRALEQ